MVKGSESVIKTVNINKRKGLIRLNQTVTDVGSRSPFDCSQPTAHPGRELAPNPVDSVDGTWQPRRVPNGKVSRKAYP